MHLKLVEKQLKKAYAPFLPSIIISSSIINSAALHEFQHYWSFNIIFSNMLSNCCMMGFQKWCTDTSCWVKVSLGSIKLMQGLVQVKWIKPRQDFYLFYLYYSSNSCHVYLLVQQNRKRHCSPQGLERVQNWHSLFLLIQLLKSMAGYQ